MNKKIFRKISHRLNNFSLLSYLINDQLLKTLQSLKVFLAKTEFVANVEIFKVLEDSL